jgi:hypothetical protein
MAPGARTAFNPFSYGSFAAAAHPVTIRIRP